MNKTIELKCSEKEFNEVSSGAKKMITREIRPANAKRFVTLNEQEECTGIIEYDTIQLICAKLSSSLTAKIDKIMLMEIVADDGSLVHYDYRGKQYQMVDWDAHLGAILEVVPYVKQ